MVIEVVDVPPPILLAVISQVVLDSSVGLPEIVPLFTSITRPTGSAGDTLKS